MLSLQVQRDKLQQNFKNLYKALVGENSSNCSSKSYHNLRLLRFGKVLQHWPLLSLSLLLSQSSLNDAEQQISSSPLFFAGAFKLMIISNETFSPSKIAHKNVFGKQWRYPYTLQSGRNNNTKLFLPLIYLCMAWAEFLSMV